ncbi:MAG: hypothetical protein CMF50_04490 [Legionellales bacterium]|nr:hypothetical protein [Legionellales bacterium]|tara:strand:- start:13705 stop:15687 length:1983 start_codon:yes stop_codon:yes gene_type:complete
MYPETELTVTSVIAFLTKNHNEILQRLYDNRSADGPFEQHLNKLKEWSKKAPLAVLEHAAKPHEAKGFSLASIPNGSAAIEAYESFMDELVQACLRIVSWQRDIALLLLLQKDQACEATGFSRLPVELIEYIVKSNQYNFSYLAEIVISYKANTLYLIPNLRYHPILRTYLDDKNAQQPHSRFTETCQMRQIRMLKRFQSFADYNANISLEAMKKYLEDKHYEHDSLLLSLILERAPQADSLLAEALSAVDFKTIKKIFNMGVAIPVLFKAIKQHIEHEQAPDLAMRYYRLLVESLMFARLYQHPAFYCRETEKLTNLDILIPPLTALIKVDPSLISRVFGIMSHISFDETGYTNTPRLNLFSSFVAQSLQSERTKPVLQYLQFLLTCLDSNATLDDKDENLAADIFTHIQHGLFAFDNPVQEVGLALHNAVFFSSDPVRAMVSPIRILQSVYNASTNPNPFKEVILKEIKQALKQMVRQNYLSPKAGDANYDVDTSLIDTRSTPSHYLEALAIAFNDYDAMLFLFQLGLFEKSNVNNLLNQRVAILNFLSINADNYADEIAAIRNPKSRLGKLFHYDSLLHPSPMAYYNQLFSPTQECLSYSLNCTLWGQDAAANALEMNVISSNDAASSTADGETSESLGSFTTYRSPQPGNSGDETT